MFHWAEPRHIIVFSSPTRTLMRKRKTGTNTRKLFSIRIYEWNRVVAERKKYRRHEIFQLLGNISELVSCFRRNVGAWKSHLAADTESDRKDEAYLRQSQAPIDLLIETHATSAVDSSSCCFFSFSFKISVDFTIQTSNWMSLAELCMNMCVLSWRRRLFNGNLFCSMSSLKWIFAKLAQRDVD